MDFLPVRLFGVAAGKITPLKGVVTSGEMLDKEFKAEVVIGSAVGTSILFAGLTTGRPPVWYETEDRLIPYYHKNPYKSRVNAVLVVPIGSFFIECAIWNRLFFRLGLF